MRDAITRLLRPRSVAVIGASATVGSLGWSVVDNLRSFGFSGEITLVNPRRAEIDGRPCVASPEELPQGIDCAVLAIPGAGIVDAIDACGRRGVGSAVVFSAGFAEADAAGLAEQNRLAETARRHGMAVAGPNCLGIVNYVDGVSLTFGAVDVSSARGRRSVAIVSQSGALTSAVRAAWRAHDVATSYAISTGNEAVTTIEDFLAFLVDDADTQVIALFVEQFRQPDRFRQLARNARERGKPVVLLHPGRSAASREAAQTHTGAMAGDHAVMRSVVAAEGVIVVDTIEELLDVSELLVRAPNGPPGDLAIMTDSGAFRGLALDYCADLGLALSAFSTTTETALRAVLPDFVPVSNPLDLTAQALVDPSLYGRILGPLLEDAGCGCVLLTVILSSERTARRKLPPIIEAIRGLRGAKRLVVAMLGEDSDIPPEFTDELRALGVAFFRSPERGLRALAQLAATTPVIDDAPAAVPTLTLSSVGTLAEHAAKHVLVELGIPIPRAELVRTRAAAQDAAARIGYPVVLKAQSAALAHKSEAGAVILDLRDATALAEGWDRLHASLASAAPDLVLDGVLVEAMQGEGVEMIVGARRDSQWGPVMLVGLGGIWAEAFQDVRILPVGMPPRHIAAEMRRLRVARLFDGFRGRPAVDVDAAARIVARLGAALAQNPRMHEIEINPLLLRPSGAVALDALIVTR